jgi:multidrug resistance efflux pump
MSASLSPIPRPAALRARDFKLRVVPIGMCLAALAGSAWLWRDQSSANSFVGEVESVVSTINAPRAGTLSCLKVDAFAQVSSNEPLAVLLVASADAIGANLASLKSDLLVTRARMTQDQVRNNQNYEQLNVSLLIQRVDLAVARSRLVYAQSELNRSQKLYEAKVISQAEFEVARDLEASLKVEVQERSQLVQEMEKTLKDLQPSKPAVEEAAVVQPIEAAIKAQEELLRQTEGPVTLRSPIDGVVTRIYRRAGENAIESEPLFEVASHRPERIIGFLRQPVSFVPQVGDPVRVRTRGNRPRMGMAQVVRVGARMELFSQPLRVRGFDSSQERGLPVIVSLPTSEEIGSLVPGELVDLIPVRSR